MVWLPDDGKILMICLFVSTQLTNVTDTRTHTHIQTTQTHKTPVDGIVSAYALHRGAHPRISGLADNYESARPIFTIAIGSFSHF